MRLTLDLDNCSRKKADNILKFLIPYATDLELWSSSSKTGYHIIAWGVRKNQVETFRKLFDDPKRIKFDEAYPNKPQQVLFTQKNGKLAHRIL